MTDQFQAPLPEGYSLLPTRGPFTDLNGPIWYKPGEDGAPTQFGFLPEKRHTNALGFVHGGMLSTLLDSSMAHFVFQQHQCRLVTLSLQMTFHNAVFPRRWVDIEILPVSEVGTQVHLEAKLYSRRVLSAEAQAGYQLFPKKS